MARRKSLRGQGRRKRSRPVNLRRKGLKSFRQNNYDQAIIDWEQDLERRVNPKVTAALAEAYFRRGVKEQDIEDLKTAVFHRPDDLIYKYHLGLAAHRDGDLSEAITAYQHVQKNSTAWEKRIAYPLALAYYQHGDDPAQKAVWHRLSADEQQRLLNVRRFQQKKVMVNEDDSIVQQGVIAYANGRYTQSQTLLDEAVTTLLDPQEDALAYYYLGCLAARDEKWETAVEHWEMSHDNDYSSPIFVANLGETHHRLAENAAQQQQYQKAIEHGKQALLWKGEDENQLNDLISHIYQQLGYQAANGGDWEDALNQWELAEQQYKINFRLACNLALAYEQADDYQEAAVRWREALRRRPRKSDHPDAISDDEIGRMWARTSVAYRKAGEFDEATHVMKQAVKWQPDNLDMRLALVDDYENNGQLQAAENELERIIKKDTNNISALLRMGEVISHHEQRWYDNGRAVRYWKRVLELEPNNEAALESLAEYYQNMGESAADSWYNDNEKAIYYYREALQYQPESIDILFNIMYCYINDLDNDAAETILNQVMELPITRPDDYSKILSSLCILDYPDKAFAMVPEIKKAFPNDTLTIYVSTAILAFSNDYPEFAERWVELAVEEHPDKPVFIVLCKVLMENDASSELVETYLHRAIEAKQEMGHVHLMLGTIYATEHDDLPAARKEWKKAKRIARKNKDEGLLEEIEMAEFMLSNPMGMLARMMENIGISDDDFDEDFFDEFF